MTNQNRSFSIGGALREGWELTKLNIGFLLIYQVIMYIVIGLITYPAERGIFPVFIFSIISLIVQMLLGMGFCRSALLLTQGNKPGYDQFYTNWRLLLSWFVAFIGFSILIGTSLILPVILYFLMISLFSSTPIFLLILIPFLTVAAILLWIVLPLFTWATFGFFPFFILDKELGPIQSLKESARATKGMRWHVLFLFLACTAINLLGILLFFVGVLITAPITLIAIASVYEKITNQSNRSIQPDDISSSPEP